MTMGEKIRFHRKRIGLTQTELGERLGVEKNAVSKWECGRVESISAAKIRTMAQLFDVSFSYLIDDEADTDTGAKPKRIPVANETSHAADEKPADEYASRISALDEHGRSAVLSILELEERRMREDTIADDQEPDNIVPMIRHYFSSPAAGFSGMEAGEDYEDIPLPNGAPRNADYCITVNGDSMEPYFPDGSLAYVQRDEPISDFDVGIFLVDGSAYIKQLCRGYNGEIYLLSANPARESANITIHPGGNQRLEYRGKVIVNKKLPRPIYG